MASRRCPHGCRRYPTLEQLASRQLRREVAHMQAAIDLTQLGQRRYQAQPQRYSPTQWVALWHVYHRRR